MKPSDEEKKLGEIFTLDEAAAKLRVSRTFLTQWIKKTNFYSKAGRIYRFSDADILSIWESMRAAPGSAYDKRPVREVAARRLRPSDPTRLRQLLTRQPRKRSARDCS